MRDYAEYFNDRKPPEKRGVSIHRDIDWWMEFVTGHMAKLLFLVLLAMLGLTLKSFVQVGKSGAYFPIEGIDILGNINITTPRDIDKTLAKTRKQSFLAVDLDNVSSDLTNLPWIASATVTRHWPNKLAVELIEHKPAYRWGENELVDIHGNRFPNSNPEIFSDLAKLNGIEDHEAEVIEAYQQLEKNLGISIERLDIKEFVLNQYLSLELHLQSGVVIKFGRDDYPQRLARFAEAFQAEKFPNFEEIRYLDFRYNRGFAVKWKPEFKPKTEDGKLVKVANQKTIGI